MLDYRILTFLTLCETMNYRMAATKLNITQPSVTQHIQYLEKYYDCQLFIYNGRQLKMTPEAITLRKFANTMFYQEEKLKDSLCPKDGYSLKIGATKTIGEYVIASHVANFLKPQNNTISIEIDNTKRILHMLDNGKIDFAIVEGFFDKFNYASRLYSTEPFVGFCSNAHHFAGKSVSLSDIIKEDLIVREEGSGTRTILEQELSNHNYSLKNFRRTTCISNFGLLESLVAKECGITFAYKVAGEHNALLSTFSVKEWDINREFNYVYLENTEAEGFVDIFEGYRK